MKFPRSVWAGSHFKNQHQMKRQIVHDENEYKQFIKTYNGRMNCYTTVYDFKSFNTKYDSYGNEISEVNQQSVVLDRIFLDFDSHDLPLVEALTDVSIVVDYLKEKDYIFNVLFSGKGFHIYVHGMITDGIRAIQAFFNEILGVLKSKRPELNTSNKTTLDNSGVQTYRLRRIANTMNMSAEYDNDDTLGCYYCIPLTLDDLKHDIDHILRLATKSRPNCRETYGKMRVAWPNIPSMHEAPTEIIEVERIGSLPIIPCLQKAITVENPSHEARVYTVSWYRDLLAMGNRYVQNDEKEQISKSILDELEHIASMENVWLDWDKDTTEYHVRYIVDGGYHAPNCNTLISKGYCPGKCWRYT